MGPRQRPPPKRGRRGRGGGGRGGRGSRRPGEEGEEEEEEEEDEGSDGGGGGGAERFEDDNWASVVDGGADERLLGRNEKEVMAKKKGKKAGYFSDESGDEDDE